MSKIRIDDDHSNSNAINIDQRERGDASDCLRWSNEEHRCSILNHSLCPNQCKSFVDDPYILLKEVDDMLDYNQNNNQSVASLKRDRKRIIERFNLRPDNIRDVYEEDKRRGSGGGHSEGDTSNSAASMKQKMKDNRPIECKSTVAEREAVREATKQWEEENEKLPKLARSSMGRGKVDSYTGDTLK